MGFPIPPPPVIGDDCVHCDGTLWLANETPRFIHVEFADLVKCPGSPSEPPNAIWVLEQDAINPCKWEFEDNNFFVIVENDGINTEIGCNGRGVAAGWDFFRDSKGGCASDFTNDFLICPANRGSRMGTAHIEWE